MTHSAIAISQFRKETDNTPRLDKLAWADFITKMGTFPVRTKKMGCPAFSGAIYPDGLKRCKDNVQKLNLFVLDFDAGNPDDIYAELDELGWEAVVASSYSYSPEKPTFRVVLRPSRPVLPSEWPELFRALTVIFPDMIDVTCKDPSHIYFWPCKASANAPIYFKHLEGDLVEVDELMEIDGKEQALTKPRSVKAKPAGSTDDKLNSRQIAEHIYNKEFAKGIWFYRQAFRIYADGYWKRLPREQEPQIAQMMLDAFNDATINQVMDAMKTLEVLAAHNPPVQDHPVLRICVNNGVLDPLTGGLADHDADDRLLFKLDIDWDPEAQAERFMQFLAEIWGQEDDYDDRVRFLQQWLGYLLLPSCKYEKFLWLEGRGANGKSVLLKIMAALVGDENVSYALLERLNKSATRAELDGKLLNISSEMSATATMADGFLKQITSGEAIEADRKYRDSVSFKPIVKLVASTNTLPRLLDRSDGFGRRAVILSFNQQFEGKAKDVDLADKIIRAELAGILAWAVAGLQELQAQQEFTIPASSIAAVKSYRTESDAVAMFSAEHLSMSSKGTPVGDLYKAFKLSCSNNGFTPCNKGEFGRRLTALGIGKRESNGKVYRLVALNPEFARVVSTLDDI